MHAFPLLLGCLGRAGLDQAHRDNCLTDVTPQGHHCRQHVRWQVLLTSDLGHRVHVAQPRTRDTDRRPDCLELVGSLGCPVSQALLCQVQHVRCPDMPERCDDHRTRVATMLVHRSKQHLVRAGRMEAQEGVCVVGSAVGGVGWKGADVSQCLVVHASARGSALFVMQLQIPGNDGARKRHLVRAPLSALQRC